MFWFWCLFVDFFQRFQCFWNESLEKLKSSSPKLCKAKNLDSLTGKYIKPCPKYTYRDYCKSHAEQKPIACAAYHYIHGLEADHPMLHIWAQKELDARLEYCQRFGILSTDYGHAKWYDHLKWIIVKHETIISVREDAKNYRKKRLLKRVQVDKVCSQELTDCRMSLESVEQYEPKKKSDDDNAFYDWKFVSQSGDEKQLEKKNINKFLFENYYNRSSLCDMQHLDLKIKAERSKKKKLFVGDDEEW